jgi:N-acetylglucosamine malate deacetylase 1
MKATFDLDILAIGAHPDDVEISCAGTLLKAADAGKRIAILDLTRGELGSRGSAEIRDQESADASAKLNLVARENLRLADGFFAVDSANKLALVRYIRLWRPKIVLINAPSDRHPDHGRGHQLASDACFLAGLNKIETTDFSGEAQSPYRPQQVYAYVQDHYHKPDLIVDIEGYWERKMEVLRCYGSQFYQPEQAGPQTPISSKEFLEHLYGRSLQMGREAGIALGEGFLALKVPCLQQIDDLI